MRRLGVGDGRLHPVDVVLDVSVRDENVEPAVEIVIEEEAAEGEGEEARCADAGGRRVVDEQVPPLVVVQRQHLVREIADQQALPAAAVVVGRVDPHRAPRLPLLTEGDARRLADLLERAIVLVPVEEVRLGVVGHGDVGPAVAVEVEGHDTERLAGRVEEPGLLCHVLERAVPPVAVEAVGRSPVRLGSAVRLADPVEGAEDVGGLGPLHVVAHEQIE